MLRVFAGLVAAVLLNGSALASETTCQDYLGEWEGVCKEGSLEFKHELYIDNLSGSCHALGISHLASAREQNKGQEVGAWYKTSYMGSDGRLTRKESIIDFDNEGRLNYIKLFTSLKGLANHVEQNTERYELISQDVLEAEMETVALGAEGKRVIRCSYDRKAE